MREEIVDQLKYKADVSIFSEAQHQVYRLMHRDSYPRFLNSPIAAELAKMLSGKKRKAMNLTRSLPLHYDDGSFFYSS